jgi:hypothetical protein
MTIPYYPHSGRRKHYWRLRAEGHRELLIKHRWHLKGAYCEKSVKGRRVMLTMVRRHPDYFVVCLCDKDDFWADVTAAARAAEAEKRRAEFRTVPFAEGKSDATR